MSARRPRIGAGSFWSAGAWLPRIRSEPTPRSGVRRQSHRTPRSARRHCVILLRSPSEPACDSQEQQGQATEDKRGLRSRQIKFYLKYRVSSFTADFFGKMSARRPKSTPNPTEWKWRRESGAVVAHPFGGGEFSVPCSSGLPTAGRLYAAASARSNARGGGINPPLQRGGKTSGSSLSYTFGQNTERGVP